MEGFECTEMDGKNENGIQSYCINKSKKFSAHKQLKNETINQVFNFANEMSFSHQGEHRANRSGGTMQRKQGQIFANAFQGKLAECAFYNFLYKNKIKATEPDFKVFNLGKWDNGDFTINPKEDEVEVSIKSTKYFANLLLLEKKDYDHNGIYLPDNKKYDCIVLVRIKPCIEDVLKKLKVFYNDTIADETLKVLKEEVQTEKWEYEIAGFISHADFKQVIAQKRIISKGATLGEKTKIDANNYYVQSGNLRSMDTFKSFIDFRTRRDT